MNLGQTKGKTNEGYRGYERLEGSAALLENLFAAPNPLRSDSDLRKPVVVRVRVFCQVTAWERP